MNSDIVRDAPLGQLIRLLTRNRLLPYPEEKPDFQCPSSYNNNGVLEKKIAEANAQDQAADMRPGAEPVFPDPETRLEEVEAQPGEPATRPEQADADALPTPLEKIETEKEEDQIRTSSSSDGGSGKQFEGIRPARTAQSQLSRVGSRTALSQSVTRADLEQAFTVASMERGPSVAVVPTRLADGTILVDWYTTDDPANPHNWSFGKKMGASTIIYLYTMAVYMGSAIYSPSIPGVQERFGVNEELAAMGLSMYVLAYGLGPMLWSPMSEVPIIGRNPPYILTYAIFVILLVPTSLVDNVAGLIVLRFLLGFFGSPCLATGGASLQDMFSLIKLPYVLSLWAFAATCGPALGPLISAFAVTAENWRWSQWELLWLAGPIWIVMFLFLPETSESNILLHRAQRLRKLTGDNRLKSQSEIDQANMKVSELAKESLWRPIQLMLLDPSIAFTAVYTALIYGIYYSFFEAFPLVYIGDYGFNLGEEGLTFLSITVGVIIAIAVYWAYTWYVVEPEIRNKGIGAPERRLIPALIASLLCPIGLFIFAWTSRSDVHWIASLIGVVIFTVGVFLIIQCIFMYLPLTYPQYGASLFAGNDFARSTLACGAIHFSSPMFNNIGIGRGVSILGGLTCGGVIGVYVLYIFGHKLRARSRFAAK